MIGGRSALLGAAGGLDYGNWEGNYSDVSLLLRNGVPDPLVPADESPTPKTITAVGDAGISITTFKYGDSALAFDGSGDYLDTSSTTAFDFANNPFTIEAWIYATETGASMGIFSNMNNGSAASLSGYVLGLGASSQLRFLDYSSGSPVLDLTSSISVTAGQWHHIAVCKQGTGTNQLRMFINGNIVASGTRNANIPAATSDRPGRVGAWRYSAETRSFNGFIDDLRITKGVARYVEGTGVNAGKMVFAGTNDLAHPLAELPANVTDDPSYNSVSLLLRNGVPGGPLVPADESPTPKEITKGGDVSISITTFKYGDSALAFNGSASYFSSPLNAGFDFGSGDFTVECWVNLNTLTVEQTFVSYTAGTTATAISFALDRLDTGVFRVYVCAGSIAYFATVSPAISTGTWYHVAGVRSGGQLRCYVNGVGGTAVSANVNVNTAAGRILRVGSLHTSTRFTNGFIDDLRITKGIARYTKNFLPPPAQLPAI